MLQTLAAAEVMACASSRSLPIFGDIMLRNEAESDLVLIDRLYTSTRAEEMAMVPWPEEQKEAFLRQQLQCQRRDWSGRMPQMRREVIEVDGLFAGRLYTDPRPVEREIRIVDIALLPEFRGRGVGTFFLRKILDEATRLGWKTSLYVESGSRARSLYERLGFEPVGTQGIYVLMESCPSAARDDASSERPACGSDGRLADFRGCLGDMFSVRSGADRLAFELVSAEALPIRKNAARGFTLLFHGPSPRLAQGSYHFEHPRLQGEKIFIVPVRHHPGGFVYEAVFTFCSFIHTHP